VPVAPEPTSVAAVNGVCGIAQLCSAIRRSVAHAE